jgi:hypothetical protein
MIMEMLLQHAEGRYGWLILDQGFISHMGWGLAVIMLAYWLGGRRLMWIAGIWWLGYNTFFHELVEENEDFANLWSDIISRGSLVVIFLALDYFQVNSRIYWFIIDKTARFRRPRPVVTPLD